MRLILVRHGLTDDNIQGILQGQIGKPLNDRGLQQAESIARRLSYHRVDGIYSSDIERARQTAQIISRHHRQLIPLYDKRLRERSVGVHSGKPYEDFLTVAKDSQLEQIHYRPDDGEALVDVARRAMNWHRDIFLRHYGHLIVVVSHGGWLRAYLNWIFHGQVDQRSWNYKHYNTGMTVVDLHEEKPKLILLNDISHLG